MLSNIVKQVVLKLSSHGCLNWMPDKRYLEWIFWVRMDKRLNLNNPVAFNEKLQWLKLYDRKPLYTKMVDKYQAKQYIADYIGKQYIIPTLGVWDTFDDIDFDRLPNRFVLKCTHDSGGLVICKDKAYFDKEAARRKMEACLKKNYYFRGREWPYKDVPRKIIAEQYMTDDSGTEPRDYKFFCFNGSPKMILVCSERFSETGLKEDFFDPDWNRLPIKRPRHPNNGAEMEKPLLLDKMLLLAQALADGIPFVRIDFYNVNGKVYFGEITFFPASGFEPFEPEKWDSTLGSWLTLPGNGS